MDRHVDQILETEYYLVAAGNKLELVDGSKVVDVADAAAQVLFCCRPPRAKLDPATETSALLNI